MTITLTLPADTIIRVEAPIKPTLCVSCGRPAVGIMLVGHYEEPGCRFHLGERLDAAKANNLEIRGDEKVLVQLSHA